MQYKNRYLYYAILPFCLLLIMIAVYVFGYNPPTQNPPFGNLPAPINAGPNSRTKEGDLTIQGNLTTGGFTMSAGAEANKVLTTNASGVATWQAAAAGATPGGTTGFVQFNDNGAFGSDLNLFWDNINERLGIGTTTPDVTLQVAGGDVRIGELSSPNTGTFPGSGRMLYFSGGPAPAGYNSDNSDYLWIARYNEAFDKSELRMFIGDNAATGAFDKFVIGAGGQGSPLTWDKFVVRSDGNVGIGTTEPSQKLDVNGGIGFGDRLAFKMGGWGYSGVAATRVQNIVTIPNVAYAGQNGFWFWGHIVQNRAQGSHNQRRVTSFSAGVDSYGYIATIEANDFGTTCPAPTIAWSNQTLAVTVNGDYTNSYVIIYAQGSSSHNLSKLVWNF